MNTEPKVTDYIDEEEKELIEAIESDDYEFGKSTLTPEKVDFFKQAAKNNQLLKFSGIGSKCWGNNSKEVKKSIFKLKKSWER